ncbi:MAG: exodeoxyribonuclease VII small subunit [Clostridia bacterium]|nr:exodeoxyribonuclease VII small subunit [Clostridia bacterium]
MDTETEELPFEDALARLEEKVELLEKGDLPLEDALKSFEEGIRMVQICNKRLKDAELVIEELIEDEEGGISPISSKVVNGLES